MRSFLRQAGLLFFATVPISVVALFKKIKALIRNHAQLAQVLRSSTKLVSFSSSPSTPFPPKTSPAAYVKYSSFANHTLPPCKFQR